ncbi:putative 5-methylcytosine g t mismatch-specific dna protein [Phaeoacremonium minimum UCRPA7]|uniref:Putative 5-methylcytosine g t mismatch-specific dna protein n=1 Tax=Phaeoacremonium minimum (strain UCR-PA7) TaxID=1286976 RepID=R8BI78_PHAM7|nr:putative 5-methylcytosine g t mismatch-specific dna protein [Phaeoacremonium minimum UCRPA7]EON99016.1 putative 5-methylcytosine g t mismatch-specific dna protein [Phaeoacremonium minimum UCRPA7]
MDPDIAEEFRGHYLRQSKKVRSAVDKWLNHCAETPAPPPQEVDDETLTFAIMTNLDQDDQPFFNALLSGARELQPALRAPTPMRKARNDFVVKSGLAIQRLYRLQQAPRDAETVMYLVKNPHMHDLLHTICDINAQEWEILISGRFDGFLWSGADGEDEAVTPTAENPSRGPTPANAFFPPTRVGTMSPGGIARFTPALGIGTRNTTPFSRGATPASFVSGTSMASSAHPNRQAVSNDEETEIAVLAELEREIFMGMEALEDAFEVLHRKAELVRTALRQRGAGLSMSLQNRRGGFGASHIDVLPQSGDFGPLDRPSWADESTASESDWGGDDFEIAPDDSASNISSSRQRRPRRRDERRTPAPIQEEDEV